MNRFAQLLCLIAIYLTLGLTLGFAASSEEMKETANTPGIQLKEGVVPDARTAIAIAVAVWTPVYGAEQIASEKPYNAILRSSKWTVTGSVPSGRVGGVATAVIKKSDGRVVKIFHTK